MSEGPTVVGSIIAKLKIDKAEWDAQRSQIKGEAAEIGRLDPTIKVDAKIGDALAKLEAVRVAQERLGFASDRLKISYQRLDEVQTKGGASESRLMQLHLAAARAESAYDQATRQLTAAKTAMAGADDVAAGSTSSLGAAQSQTAATGWLLAAGIGAIIALIGPLASAIVGLTGGLLGMGAAGVFAVFGILQAMKAGTAVGSQYTQGMATLKSLFEQLSSTTAVEMLGAFQKSSDLIAQAMPQLNAEIAKFTDILGNAGVSALDGTIGAFQTLNPLFVEGAQLIANVAAGFDQWANSGGLQQFATYAERELPQVFRTVGLLSDAIVKLTQELSPAGDAMVNLIGDAALLVKGLGWLQDRMDSLLGTWEKANNYFSSNPIFAAIVQTVLEAANPIQTFNKHMNDLGLMLGSLGTTSNATGSKIAANTQQINDLGKATTAAQTALSLFNQQLQGLGQTNLSAAQANIAFQQSLADATAAIAKNGASLDLSTQAGRDNMSALDGIATNAHAVSAAQQAAGASADSLSQQMGTARQAFIKAALAAGDTTDQANKLADQYGLIPKDVSTAFHDSGAQQAIADALAVKAAYDNINTQITIRVNSIISNAAANPNGMGLGSGGLGKADGGTIGMSSGGTVFGPGTASSDTAGLYRLARGEEVISNKNGQADAWRPVLKAINAGQTPNFGQASVSKSVVNNYHIYEAQNPQQLVQAVAMHQNALGAA